MPQPLVCRQHCVIAAVVQFAVVEIAAAAVVGFVEVPTIVDRSQEVWPMMRQWRRKKRTMEQAIAAIVGQHHRHRPIVQFVGLERIGQKAKKRTALIVVVGAAAALQFGRDFEMAKLAVGFAGDAAASKRPAAVALPARGDPVVGAVVPQQQPVQQQPMPVVVAVVVVH